MASQGYNTTHIEANPSTNFLAEPTTHRVEFPANQNVVQPPSTNGHEKAQRHATQAVAARG